MPPDTCSLTEVILPKQGSSHIRVKQISKLLFRIIWSSACGKKAGYDFSNWLIRNVANVFHFGKYPICKIYQAFTSATQYSILGFSTLTLTFRRWRKQVPPKFDVKARLLRRQKFISTCYSFPRHILKIYSNNTFRNGIMNSVFSLFHVI